MSKQLAMNSIGTHIIQALRAMHDQSIVANVKYVDNIAAKLSGRDRFACMMYINELDDRELVVLCNRIQCSPLQIRNAVQQLRVFN